MIILLIIFRESFLRIQMVQWKKILPLYVLIAKKCKIYGLIELDNIEINALMILNKNRIHNKMILKKKK